jgi:glycosyltransferase involved in cell wall biosynthesis
LRIAIDTHFVTSGNATGNRTYTSELVQAMIALDTPHEFILYAIEDHPYYHRFDDNPRVKVRYVLSANGLVRNFYSIPKALSEDKPDLVHLLFILPSFTRTPSVLTVHDLFYVHQRDIGLYNRVIGYLTTWSIPRAEKVITISEFSRLDILRYCGVEPSHVISIPLGKDSRFTPVKDSTAVREKLGISKNYILYVGRTEDPRKNLATLIDAYAVLRKKGQIDEQLVIAGRHGPGTEILFKKVEELGLKSCILFPGIVPEEDLAALLSGATMFVYVSSFEGFGLPVLEAMACGVPVITSNVSSLPEVAGDAALMVSPYDANELTQAMKRVLSDKSLQETMRERGLRHAQLYDWVAVATRTIQTYEEIIKE